MTLRIEADWITSDRCKQVAMVSPAGGWVLSWCSGTYSRDEAIAALTRAEEGDLTTEPTVPLASGQRPAQLLSA